MAEHDPTTVPAKPLRVCAGHDFLKKGAQHRTYGIDVSYLDYRGLPEWHGNMIEVHGNEQLRNTILERLGGAAMSQQNLPDGGSPAARRMLALVGDLKTLAASLDAAFDERDKTIEDGRAFAKANYATSQNAIGHAVNTHAESVLAARRVYLGDLACHISVQLEETCVILRSEIQALLPGIYGNSESLANKANADRVRISF